MIRSMTGFGAATGEAGGARVTVELRSVNHRFFSPAIKLPPSLARFEGEVREVLRRGIARGHVTVTVRLDRAAAGGAEVVDEARFGAYARLLRGLRDRHGLGGEVDVATVLRLPDVLTPGGEGDEDLSPGALTAVVDEALDRLCAMREAEGARLAELLRDRLRTVSEVVERLTKRAPVRLTEERDRLRRAARELADGLEVGDQRLAQEIALLADRLDVAEELDRLRAHVGAFHSALGAPAGEAVGKRLGFLLQEMLREANTTGSKARDAQMLHDVVALKEELERLGEQVENVE